MTALVSEQAPTKFEFVLKPQHRAGARPRNSPTLIAHAAELFVLLLETSHSLHTAFFNDKISL